VVIQNGRKVGQDLNHCDLPDPVADRFKELETELANLKNEVEQLRKGTSEHGDKVVQYAHEGKRDI
jgi:serine O-acetyltransferase